MDDMDRAQAREQLDTALAIKAQQGKVVKLNTPKLLAEDGKTELCWQCHEPIPPERLRHTPEARFCVPCLEALEQRTAWTRR